MRSGPEPPLEPVTHHPRPLQHSGPPPHYPEARPQCYRDTSPEETINTRILQALRSRTLGDLTGSHGVTALRGIIVSEGEGSQGPRNIRA